MTRVQLLYLFLAASCGEYIPKKRFKFGMQRWNARIIVGIGSHHQLLAKRERFCDFSICFPMLNQLPRSYDTEFKIAEFLGEAQAKEKEVQTKGRKRKRKR